MQVPQVRQPRSLRRRLLLAAASGVLLTLLFPPFELSLAAWVGLTPLLLAVEGASPAVGFLLGWLSGTLEAIGVTGYWICVAARDYFHLSPLGAAAFTAAILQIFVAPYLALFGLAAAWIAPSRWRVLFIPALFVATEYARAHFLSGNPWELLGHSQQGSLLIQVCDLTGVYGLSFLAALVAAATVELRRSWIPAAVAAVMLLVVLAYGAWRLASFTDDGAQLDVVMVQANLPNAQRGRPELFADHLQRYLDLTQTAQPSAGALIIWPENAIGFFPEENASLTQRIIDVTKERRTAVLAGAPRAGGSAGVAALYNSAYLITAGGIQDVYDKRMLLPFIERQPLRPGDGPYRAGSRSTIFAVDETRFGVLICYESIYPELSRDLVNRGAQFLVNISNDSWFEAGAGPAQHYALSRFRAVENRVSLVRVTNSGVSGVIDPTGREVVRLPGQRAIAQTVRVPIGPGESFYTRHGDLFAALCIALSGVALLRAAKPRS